MEEYSKEDIILIALDKIVRLCQKDGVRKCFLHRDHITGALQLNFEFDRILADYEFSDGLIEEINICAYWEQKRT